MYLCSHNDSFFYHIGMVYYFLINLPLNLQPSLFDTYQSTNRALLPSVLNSFLTNHFESVMLKCDLAQLYLLLHR
jgi:hypothetical protein